ncbi:serine hydrolase domain-containing protein [Arenimonas sp.]|uniref:serine hydrolase domain-containing protein n=1 Tax=Arenimonas sp. TaxID=1872635 RepID=UPI0025BD5918|nr:serine hydrolase domain-containing protein [Arenimonas sp.]
MPRKKANAPSRLPAAVAALWLAVAGTAAAADAAKAPDFTAHARELEVLAEGVVTQSRIPGMAMAIVQDGKVVSLRGYGVVDSRDPQPVGTDTVFRVASLSKAFAGTLSAMLVSEGAMNWDAPIANQLPAFTLRDLQGAQRLTVREVLSHRVGLGYNAFDRDLEADQPYPLLAEKLSDAPLTCAPGDCYAYQNIAFSLVGDLVFAVTGDFYHHQVEKRLFHPLGMYGATFGRDGLEASPSWARPHVRSGGKWLPVRPKETYYRIPPAAGVNASIRDMSQWLIAQMGHRPDVLPPALLNEIQTPQVETPGEIRGNSWRRERLRSAYYGLGWRIYDYAGHTLVYHAGAVQGYRAMAAFLPDQDIGVVVLWNSESSMPAALLPTALDRALGLPARDWLAPEPVKPRRRR